MTSPGSAAILCDDPHAYSVHDVLHTLDVLATYLSAGDTGDTNSHTIVL